MIQAVDRIPREFDFEMEDGSIIRAIDYQEAIKIYIKLIKNKK